jgi:photosystem II stability/assembly factor-like uncharacterized protein
MLRRLALLPLLLLAPTVALPDRRADEPTPPRKGKADGKSPAYPLTADAFAGLRLRAIGPAVCSGRIAGFAVHPRDRSQYYVAVASGGVWKTTNAGTTYTPVFDAQGSYSIGYVALDPKDPNVVWVGTGENNSQRSVGYGDGLYKSVDGGKTWKNVALGQSEHIGKILLDPRNSNTVYVAAQGPLWGPGGDRGLYKTTDGGATWVKVLKISDNTGVTDVVLDPRNPDVLLAAAYQRRRHVWTLINGGPESALYRSTDAGATWTKVTAGLPKADLGRIGLAVAPSNPDVVYAAVEAADGKGGIFRSADRGVTWERRNPFDQGAMYYGHVVVDPKNADRIYVMNVFIQVSDDGGKTLRNLGERWKHVDNHCMWIDPDDNNHYLVGCDGGIYESLDCAASWRHHANLPVTQFYDVAVDEAAPFYHVYGGTQDNFTLGGPARTRSVHGITNADWFVTQDGDGFQSRVDPRDPNIVYSELQYGGLVRFNRRTGERVGIQPQPGAGEPALRWNWDSPLLLSAHMPTRLYFAANKVFRSDDRGDSWTAISGDLTRQIDRDKLAVMGKVWGADAVAKHASTSFYGNIVALAESPVTDGPLYAATDDGLIHATTNGGKTWHKHEKFPGVPDRTYVSRLLTSRHDARTVYASFDNHKNADFAPYLLKSTNGGRTWVSLRGDLPANGPVLAIAEDHEDPNLLFVGTEFGLFFSVNGGKNWVRLKGNLPTIAVRDLAIQRRENDLVLATFGRGIYVLDDYTPLRKLDPAALKQPGHLFPIKDALLYIQTRQYGLRGKSFLGASFFTAENPPFGAAFTYHLAEALQTQKEKRQAAEKKGKTILLTKDELRAEAEEEAPAVVLTVSDADGKPIRTLTGPVTKGFHRVSWDLRTPSANLPPPRQPGSIEDLFAPPPGGPLVLPGNYQVTLSARVGGVVKPLAGPQPFKVAIYEAAGRDPADSKDLLAFQRQVSRLQRAVSGALSVSQELEQRMARVKRTLDHTPTLPARAHSLARSIEKRNRDILRALRGDVVLAQRNENVPPSIAQRVRRIFADQRLSMSRPTKTHREQYAIASAEFGQELGKLRALINGEVKELNKLLDAAGAPWTPGRLPAWGDK